MFEDKRLIKKFGSWTRVQVAFYDFIFQHSLNLCPRHFREKAVEESKTGGFADGEDLYERSVKVIEKTFPSFESAWKAFIEEN